MNKKINGKLLIDESLSSYTSWRVGGRAKYLYKPTNLTDLITFLQHNHDKQPFFWFGLGSNILVRDRGLTGTAILTHPGLKTISLEGKQIVRVEAGVSCGTMARFCARKSLQGAEFWAGIPGTMGGALQMNAGCFGGETWARVIAVETIDARGIIRCRSCADYHVGYRSVQGPEAEWFVAAICKLQPGNKQDALSTIRSFLTRRANTQPTGGYSCGSVFRNPTPEYAGQLIESCDLKGYRIGGCYVSTKHANFIINDGSANSANLEDLIQHVKNQVLQNTGILLQREVKIVGER